MLICGAILFILLENGGIKINKIDVHKQICDQIYDTYVAKNHDYGDSFGESIQEFGPIAGVVRLNDKMNRIKTLVNGDGDRKVTDESVKDALLDLANYAIMLSMELDCDASIKDLIKEEFKNFLVEYKYPGGISNMNILYNSRCSLATWTINDDSSLMVVGLPSIEELRGLGVYERQDWYKEITKEIASC